MRISDWSSDVCSSDLVGPCKQPVPDREGCSAESCCDDRATHPEGERMPSAAADAHAREGGCADDRPVGQYGQRASEIRARSEEHTSELQSLMRISYAVFCLKKKKNYNTRAQKQCNN